MNKLLHKLLETRGLDTEEKIEKFLNPDYGVHLHDPFLLSDMHIAVERILKALEKQEKIVVYSDYDADGIPGAVILHDFLKFAGHTNFENYIPDRHEEGFGLHAQAIESFARNSVKLIITIDCGIANLTQVMQAKSFGIDVIVTDHHEPTAGLPEAFAVINPKHPKFNYPFSMLCGAAVVYKLVQAIVKANKNTFVWQNGKEKWLLDMAGLATLSDMVPLIDENRVLAFYGLAVLRKSRRLGLRELFRKLRINQYYLSEDDVTFMITPRINAASRLGNPKSAFHLLSTDKLSEADTLSTELNKMNDTRKGLVAAIVKEIEGTIKERPGMLGKVIVMGNPNWRPSLLGLVAGNLAEKYNKPVFLWGRDGGNIIKGSWRSPDINVIPLLENIREELIEFGGHKVAGGFSLAPEKVHTFPDSLNTIYEKMPPEESKAKIIIDETLSCSDITWETLENIERLAPFGIGNPKPIFLLKNLYIKDVRKFGKQKKHLEVSFTEPKLQQVTAIIFFASFENVSMLQSSVCVTIRASLEKYVFRNNKSLRLRVEDIYVSE